LKPDAAEERTLNLLAAKYPDQPTEADECAFLEQALEALGWPDAAAELFGLDGVNAEV